MKRIVLNNDSVATVDNDIYKQIKNLNWGMNKGGYAVKSIKGKITFMHHFVLPKIRGLDVDHINRNKLDNRKKNLRYVTRSENMFNTSTRSTNTSGFKGAYLSNQSWRENRWYSKVTINYKQFFKGYFATREEAHEVYKQMLKANLIKKRR